MNRAVRYAFLKLKARTLLVFVQPKAAQRAFESMLCIRPHDAYALASCGHLYAAQNSLPAAIGCLQRLVETSPHAASGWFNLGYLLQKSGEHSEAETAFRKAVALDERMDRAWYGLGLALMHAQQFDEAVVTLKKATVLQPMSPHAWYRLAQAWEALGKGDEVRKVLLHLREFEPKVAAQLERQTLALSPLTVAPHAAP